MARPRNRVIVWILTPIEHSTCLASRTTPSRENISAKQAWCPAILNWSSPTASFCLIIRNKAREPSIYQPGLPSHDFLSLMTAYGSELLLLSLIKLYRFVIGFIRDSVGVSNVTNTSPQIHKQKTAPEHACASGLHHNCFVLSKW